MGQKSKQGRLWDFFSLFLVLFCRWEVMPGSLRGVKRYDGSPGKAGGQTVLLSVFSPLLLLLAPVAMMPLG